MPLELVQSCGPQPAIRFEPLGQLLQWFGPHPIEAPLRLDPNVHEAGVSQYAKMLRNSGLADAQLGYEIPHPALFVSKKVKDTPPVRFDECLKRDRHHE
jgi:hypothetical protein